MSRKSLLQKCFARVSYRNAIQEGPKRVTHKSVPQECPTNHESVPQDCSIRVSDKSGLQECPTKSALQERPTRVFHKSVTQECPTRVTYKSVGQECLTRVFHKSIPQQCPARMSDKSVRQECLPRVSHKSVIQECPARVHKSVPQEWWQLCSATCSTGRLCGQISVVRECPTRPTRVSCKSVPQSDESVARELPQERKKCLGVCLSKFYFLI